MFQTVGHHVINLYAEAVGLPLYRGVIKGDSLCKGANYDKQDGDEVEDLYQLLQKIKVRQDFVLFLNVYNAYSIQSTWLYYRLVRFLTVAYKSKHYIRFVAYGFTNFSSGCVILIQSFLWVLS